MKFLENVDGKWVIAGLGTLAVFGSFVVGAIFYAILLGLGFNDDLAWGLAVLAWIGVVAVGIGTVVSYYKKHLANTNNVEQVTVIREVLVQPQAAPQIVTAEPERRTFPDQPSTSTASYAGYHPMLVEGDETVELKTPAFSDEQESPVSPSVSYRSLLSEDATVEPETPTFSSEPERSAAPSVRYRSLLPEENDATDADTQSSNDESNHSEPSSVSYRSLLSENNSKDDDLR